jgi:hypothetical protein
MKKLACVSNIKLLETHLSSIHAEDYCLKILENKFSKMKIGKKTKIHLLVVRLSRSGELKYSRPCSSCIKRIKKSPIKIENIYYSNREYGICYEKYQNLITTNSTFVSRGSRSKSE